MLADLQKIDETEQTPNEVKLVITDDGRHSGPERDELFKKKITAYANYIKSPRFTNDFSPQGKQVTIQLVSEMTPSAKMQSIMNSVMGLPQKDKRFQGMQLIANHQPPATNYDLEPLEDEILELSPTDEIVGAPLASAAGQPANSAANMFHDRDLLRGPSLIFVLVAAADGDIDEKEFVAFKETLAAAEEFGAKCPVLGRALDPETAVNGINYFMEQIGNGVQFDPIAELEKLNKAADQSLNPQHCEFYKMGLLFIGQHIAEASGGFLGIFGSKISKDERMALGAIAQTLNIHKYLDE